MPRLCVQYSRFRQKNRAIHQMTKRKNSGKSPIFRAEPYRNENASISFGAAIVGAIQAVRKDVAIMSQRTEVDEYAPGAIHVLRKLCQDEEKSLHLYKAEVLEWQAVVFAWLDRVEERIPDTLRSDYRANLQDDFNVILAAAGGQPRPFLAARSEPAIPACPV